MVGPVSRVINCAGFVGRWTCLLCLLWSGAHAEAQRLQVVRAYFPSALSLRGLNGWTNPLAVDWQRGFVILEVEHEALVRLRDLGFQVVPDPRLSAAGLPSQNSHLSGIPGFPCYPTWAETQTLALEWVRLFPDLVSWLDIGDSWEKSQGLGGSDIAVLVLTNNALMGPKPTLLVMSGLHPRELSPGGITTRFAQFLLDGYGLDADITWLLDHHEIQLILAANPDGRVQAEAGLSWRKNRNDFFCSGSSARGVDLNRNFAFQWALSSSCSDASQCSNTFRGPSPASEFEIQAIAGYLQLVFPDQRGPDISDAAPADASGIFLDLHSFSRLVLWPYGFDETPAPNHLALTSLGRKLAWFNDYRPEKASASFDTCGTSDDFAYGDLGVAAFTFEIGSHFFEPCENFESTIWPRNRAALLYAAKAARAPYLLASGPNIDPIRLASNAVALGTSSLRLDCLVDDNRFQTSNGLEPVDPIAGAELYVDVPPWQATAPTLDLLAADGSFNDAQELVFGHVDVSLLTEGRHSLFVRGLDQAGSWGVPTAAFVNINDPATHVNIRGFVRELGSAIPLSAQVSCADSVAWADPVDGSFSLVMAPGEWPLRVELLGYESVSFDSVGGGAGETVHLEFNLVPLCEQVWMSPQESWGWHGEGDWSLIDLPDFPSELVWSDSPDGDYAPSSDYSLTSPPLKVQQSGLAFLNFIQRFQLDPYGDDFLSVEISLDGSPFASLTSFRGSQAWNPISLPLGDLSSSGTFRLRFRLHADEGFGHEGWSLRQLSLSGSGSDNACALALLYSNWPLNISVLDMLPFLPKNALALP